MLAVVLAAWLAGGPAHACEALTEPPATLQVAWVSRVRATVGAHTPMQVVRSVELQQLARDRGGDVSNVLRALGLVGPRATADASDWKVSFFDVSRADLCRPMAGVEGDVRAGVPVCSERQQHPWRSRARSWTGCGYLHDVATAARTLDVFRLEWGHAVRDGFCLLPLARLLAGRSS